MEGSTSLWTGGAAARPLPGFTRCTCAQRVSGPPKPWFTRTVKHTSYAAGPGVSRGHRKVGRRPAPGLGLVTPARLCSFIIWSRPCSFLLPERETKSEQTKMQDEYGLWIPLMSSRKDETAVWY